MFYEDSLISNTTTRCNENANWSFNSSKLSCYKGSVLANKKVVKMYTYFYSFIYGKTLILHFLLCIK